MKLQYISIIALLAYTVQSSAQAVSNPVNNIPTEMPDLPPVTSYPGLNNLSGITRFNYIRTQVPDQPVTSISASTYYRQSAEYFDGLGRPLQSVQKKAHADGYDLVQHHVYDSVGREAYGYLPFALPLAYSDGNLTWSNLKTLFTAFYPGSTGEHPYSKTEFDNSLLNRVTRQLPQGASWIGADRGKVVEYATNTEPTYSGTVGTSIVFWKYKNCFPRYTIGATATALPVYAGNYNEKELYITRVTDEDSNVSEEVRDKLGRMIMQRRVAKDFPPAATMPRVPAYGDPLNLAYTIYVYDDLNRLRFVIPPEAAKPTVATSTSGSTTTFTHTFPAIDANIAAGLCYRYVYDSRGRLIEKQIPGKGSEEYVYDQRDRQIYYRDARIKADGKWMFTIYDALDRPVVTGLIPATGSQASMTSILTSTTVYPEPSIWFYLRNYNLWHTYPTTITTSLGSADILSYTYYDDYADLPATGYSYNSSFLPSVTQPYLVRSVRSNNTRGLVTGTKVKVMDGAATPNWLTTVNYYDEKGRLIQAVASNHKGGKDYSSNTYYFQGMLWKNIFRQQNPSALPMFGTTYDMTINTLETTYERNIGIGGGNDQVWKVTKTMNGDPEYEFAYYDYDHLGHITTKMFPSGNVLQEYNIQGWLQYLRAYNSNGPLTDQKVFFEQNLYYDKGFASKFYNGNIAGTVWTGYRPTAAALFTQRAYGYDYDKLGRLDHAEYRHKQFTGTTWVKTATDYTMSGVTYDLNGNIKSMNQRGTEPGSSTPEDMDLLIYTYKANSNQLIKVEDGVPAANTALLPDFKNNANTTTEYTYDVNGNMLTDGNRKISATAYSYLNKPEQITVTGLGTIKYLYDALGNRLQKVITPTSGTTYGYDYIGNFVYKDNRLEYIMNEEGRSRPKVVGAEVKYTYDYFVKDHLGNVRTSVNAEPMTADYLASHEISAYAAEHLVFDNIENVWDDNPAGTPGNETSAHLVASDPAKRIGTAIMLRTMPGDEFRISADCFYQGAFTPGSTVTPADMVSSLTSALLGGETYTGVPVSEMQQNVAIITQAMNNPALPSQLNSMLSANTDPSAPRAYLNYLMFDQNLQLIPAKSGAVQVPTGSGSGIPWTTIRPSILDGELLRIDVPGYIIIYINNNSIGKDVYFDDIKIEHYNGNVLEESHYYPFGLTVSQMAPEVTAPINPYKYNTKELETAFGLQNYEYGARQYNSQIGRWNSIDPFADKYHSESPFAYVSNNPVKYVDPDGRFKLNYNDAQLKANGLTRGDVQRFESIVTNIGNLVSSNPQAMDAIANTTGFDQSRILSDLEIGNGPDITISAYGPGARGGKDGIIFDPSVVKSLANIDPNNTNELSEQTLGLALNLLHEYGHYGDQTTNGGKNTGQYDDDKTEPNGRRQDTKAFGDRDNQEKGKQKWSTSLTGHRGNDITTFGFGVNVGLAPGGKSVFMKPKLSNTIPKAYGGKIPTSLPKEAKDILNTLNVK
ncbi:RHS repeat-associated core domain-containing protein [Niabella sp. CC-SYL272]|uniref:DUF6443 domain-containing protein n=1 Tax=Niabella agricola TaxID=2891571 RepID=UPI001F34FFCC|nr:DUF6443 domain-containing protein [Niabella agricola]MCF3109589.1 RHS repeat-associated core domain-containing protein [Niabella agricola]